MQNDPVNQAPHNPEGRVMLALGLIAAFMFFWYTYVSPPKKPVVDTAQNSKTAATVQGTQSNANQASLTQGSDQAIQQNGLGSVPENQAKQNNIAPWQGQLKSQNDALNISLSNKGGTIVQAHTLKHFKTSQKQEAVALFPENAGNSSSPIFWKLKIKNSDDSVTSIKDSAIVYKLVDESSNSVRFAADLNNGLKLEKTFTLAANENNKQYSLDHSIKISNTGDSDKNIQSSLNMLGQEQPAVKKRFAMFSPPANIISILARINDSESRWPISKINGGKKLKVPMGPTQWFGVEQQYFLTAAMSQDKLWESFTPQKGSFDKQAIASASYAPWNLAKGESIDYKVNLYLGPKDIHILENQGQSLERAIDLGSWLGPIARPILRFLKFLCGFTKNYGIAIIILTVLVRLMMFPLTMMQARSMKKMQAHKPQMDALKERFGDDKENYNKALMTYMRENKVNPAGGCLLLLPQLPIFFALYRVLYNSIELRHAPFAAWINDLSAHDPWFILPILLGVAMFFQQKLTPSAGMDPAQQAMMKFIPVMFTVFMIFLPAGLNLYILISTLWGIGQQYFVYRSTGSKSMVAGI